MLKKHFLQTTDLAHTLKKGRHHSHRGDDDRGLQGHELMFQHPDGF